MNKQTYAAGACFILSEIFAVSSLTIVDWIHSSDDAGSFTLGLTHQCLTIYNRQADCFSSSLPAEWVASLFFLVCGIVALAITFGFVLSSKWRRRHVLLRAKWSAFVAIGALCSVGMLFPIGFRQEVVGGEAYRLPDSWSVGISYKCMWVLAVVLAGSGLFVLLTPMRWWF